METHGRLSNAARVFDLREKHGTNPSERKGPGRPLPFKPWPAVDTASLGRGGSVCDLECVMSSWWLASEAGAGEAAVEDVVAVLEQAQTAPDCGDQALGVGERSVGRGGASQHRPDALYRVEVGWVGPMLLTLRLLAR